MVDAASTVAVPARRTMWCFLDVMAMAHWERAMALDCKRAVEGYSRKAICPRRNFRDSVTAADGEYLLRPQSAGRKKIQSQWTNGVVVVSAAVVGSAYVVVAEVGPLGLSAAVDTLPAFRYDAREFAAHPDNLSQSFPTAE
jgi:hypothetical protein